MVALAAVVALTLAAPAPGVLPTPVGAGAPYLPTPGSEPARGLACREGGAHFDVHLEIFANRRAVVVPAGIGVARPFDRRFGAVVPRACTYPLRTLAPTGVVEVRLGERRQLGELFRLWGRPLERTRLLGFRDRRPVSAFVAGRPWRRDPRTIPLAPRAQIVLEIGGYVPPHPSFLFPGDL
jgi:hypothetical protein